jgi:predicted O-methyltransferase YrrM
MDPVKFWNEKISHINGLKNQLVQMQEINMCGTPQPEYLFSLAYSLTIKGAIVEIGTCSGISLVCLAMAQKLKKGDPVISIDLKKHADIDKNLSNAGVSDYAKCIIGDANKVAKDWANPISMLWIDGDHTYKGASKDISAWSRFVIEGGLIAMHDYNSECGVFKAINRNILSRPWIWRVLSDREYGSIFVAQKIKINPSVWVDPYTKWNKVKLRTKRVMNKLLKI